MNESEELITLRLENAELRRKIVQMTKPGRRTKENVDYHEAINVQIAPLKREITDLKVKYDYLKKDYENLFKANVRLVDRLKKYEPMGRDENER